MHIFVHRKGKSKTMLKRFIARLLIITQVYGCFFHGLAHASIYDEMPKNYKISIGSSSASEFSPQFKLFAVDLDSPQETLLEDLSLEGISSGRIATDIDEKAMTATAEGLVWDVDGLRFMTTSEGCLVVKGTSSNRDRQWVIQTAASVILDVVDADNFEITSPLVITTGTSDIRSLRLRGIDTNSQWLNQGNLTTKEAFLEKLWLANEGSLALETTRAATAFGIINKGEFKGQALDVGRGLLHNEATANMAVAAVTVAGNLTNEGIFKTAALTSTASASINNSGSMNVDAWTGDLDDLLNHGTFSSDRVDLEIKAIRSANLLRLGAAPESGVLRVQTIENRGAAAFGKVQVTTSLVNNGEVVADDLSIEAEGRSELRGKIETASFSAGGAIDLLGTLTTHKSTYFTKGLTVDEAAVADLRGLELSDDTKITNHGKLAIEGVYTEFGILQITNTGGATAIIDAGNALPSSSAVISAPGLVMDAESESGRAGASGRVPKYDEDFIALTNIIDARKLGSKYMRQALGIPEDGKIDKDFAASRTILDVKKLGTKYKYQALGHENELTVDPEFRTLSGGAREAAAKYKSEVLGQDPIQGDPEFYTLSQAREAGARYKAQAKLALEAKRDQLQQQKSVFLATARGLLEDPEIKNANDIRELKSIIFKYSRQSGVRLDGDFATPHIPTLKRTASKYKVYAENPQSYAVDQDLQKVIKELSETKWNFGLTLQERQSREAQLEADREKLAPEVFKIRLHVFNQADGELSLRSGYFDLTGDEAFVNEGMLNQEGAQLQWSAPSTWSNPRSFNTGTWRVKGPLRLLGHIDKDVGKLVVTEALQVQSQQGRSQLRGDIKTPDLEADELVVAPGSTINTQRLKIAGGLSAFGEVVSKQTSSIGGAITVDATGSLALEGFSGLAATARTVRNAGKVFIGFTPEYGKLVSKAPWTIENSGQLTIDQRRQLPTELFERIFEEARSRAISPTQQLVFDRIALMRADRDISGLADLHGVSEEISGFMDAIMALQPQERAPILDDLAKKVNLIVPRFGRHDPFMSAQVKGAFDFLIRSTKEDIQTARDISVQQISSQHAQLDASQPRISTFGEAAPKTALPVSFTNTARGSLRIANGEFFNTNSTNADGGVIEFEDAQVWHDRFTNRGMQNLKGAYQIHIRGAGTHVMGKTRGDSPLTLYMGETTDVLATLSASPIQAPEVIIEKPGDLVISQKTELPFPLKIKLSGSGNFTAREMLKAHTIEIEANNVLGSLNLGRVISTQGLLRIIARGEFANPESFFFGKTGLEIFSPKIGHGNPLAKTGARLRSQGPIKLDTTKASGSSTGAGVAGRGTIDINFVDVSADGTMEIDTGVFTNTAGYVYALLDGRVNATKMVVKRLAPSVGGYYPACPGHTEYHPSCGSSSYRHGSGQACQRYVSTIAEQSDAGLFLSDRDLTLNVPTLEIDGSTVAGSGNVILNAKPVTTTLTAVAGFPGLTITARSTAPAHLHGGSSIKGAVLGTANITGRITSEGAIALGAADFLIHSVGMVDARGTPVRLLDVTAAISAAHASGHPLLTSSQVGGATVVDHVAPLDLVRSLGNLPLFSDAALPASVSLGAALPLVEEFSRQMLRGLVTGSLGVNESTLRMMCANAEEFAQQRHRRVMEEESRVNGALVRFSRYPSITEADMQQAAYAMVYTKFKEGVSHTTAAIQAERRHQLAQAVDAELEQAITQPTSTPTLEAWMVIPAQQAPRSLTEVRGANVTLTGSSSISLERGRETVREGDEVRGREFERHLDPVLVEATTGRVTLDAPHTVLADARPSGTQGVAITGTVVDASRPLASHSWDHTEALRRQQEEEAMRSSMGGGMGMGGMFPETSAVSFSFGAGGTSVSGFTPSSGGDWQSIEHPGRREMMRQTEMARQYPFMSRQERERAHALGTPGFDPMAEFERMMSVAKPQDTYRRIVPNGIIERMETHAFHMQQEHAWEQFRQELEEAETLDARASSAASADAKPPKTTREAIGVSASKAAIKKVMAENPGLAKTLEVQKRAKAQLREAARLEQLDGELSRDAYISRLSLDALDADGLMSAKEMAQSLRLSAYRMIAETNDYLNQFAREHPDLAYYTVKTLEYGAMALHAGAYVGAAMTAGPAGVATLFAIEQAMGATLQAAVEAGGEHAARSASNPLEAERLRESFYELVGKGEMVGTFIWFSKGLRGSKPGHLKPESHPTTHHPKAQKMLDCLKEGFGKTREYVRDQFNYREHFAAERLRLEARKKSTKFGRYAEAEDVGLLRHKPLEFDYSSHGAPYSLRVDPLTGTGPMHVDARNFTSATSHTADGAQRNAKQFWQLWKEKYPDTMSAGNLEKINLRRDTRAPRVDEQWIRHFPEHAEYLGEILVHHHIDHGHLTTALPSTLHGRAPGNAMFHDILRGKK